MPVFEYRGLNESGKAISGLKEADSAKSLRAALRKDGIFLTEVVGQMDAAAAGAGRKAGATVDLRKLARGRITTDDIAIATRQLATLLHAGVALVEALTALVDQVEKEQLKRVYSDIKQRVNEGSSLGDALAQHQKVFGSLYVNMVKAGEHSGALDAVLARLADFTEGQARLQQKVIGTLTYPAIMILVGAGIMAVLMTVVIPKVTKVFQTMRQELPWTTKLLIGVATAFQNWWFVILPALVTAVVGFVAWTRSEKGKPVWDRWVLKFPVIGNLVRMVVVARFSRTLATLLKSGVPLLGALDIVKAVITNSVMSDALEMARDSIREGESIATPLKRSGEFPPLVYHMVAIGEKSGQLEEMLVSIADSYENQVDVRIGAMTSLLEPVMIVAMGVVIGFIAFSILMPILQMNTAVH
ncbi:MAG: type II secretion system inner membrane protein GspF [Myxococcaceae bacterium]|nr:type II secretion system inner membrane protein GspF [Myxococcaceae bacterium]